MKLSVARASNCSVVVSSTELRSLTGALQEAQCAAYAAAEEEKEQDICGMHLSARAREQGSRSSAVQTAVFVLGTLLPTCAWTGLDQVQ